jgi:hypothetical protein
MSGDLSFPISLVLGGGGGSSAFSALTGNPTDNSALAAALDNVLTPYDMPGTVVDVAQVVPNRFTCTASSHTLSFSATPADGTQFSLMLLGHTSDCTLTIPSCYSELLQIAITSFVVPANSKLTVFFERDGSTTRIIGAPFAGTWATISAIAPATGTEAFVTDLFGGTKCYYNGTRWRAVNKFCTVASDGATYSLPVTTTITEQLYAHPSILIPGGFIGPNDTIWIQFHASHTADGGANGVSVWCRLDTSASGVTGTSVAQRTAINATGSTKREQFVRMVNSVSSQQFWNGETSTFETGNAIATASLNFAADVYVKFTGDQATSNTGLPQLRGYSVVVIQGG